MAGGAGVYWCQVNWIAGGAGVEVGAAREPAADRRAEGDGAQNREDGPSRPAFSQLARRPLTEVARSDLPCGYAIRQDDYLGGPICAAVCPGDSLADLSRDGLLIGRSSVRETTKRLVSGLLSLDGPGWEIRCKGSITISKNSLCLRPPAGFEPAHTAPETVAGAAVAPTLTRENTPPGCLPGRCSLATLSRCPERRRAPGLCRRSARHAWEPGHLARLDHVLPGPAVSRRPARAPAGGASESQKVRKSQP